MESPDFAHGSVYFRNFGAQNTRVNIVEANKIVSSTARQTPSNEC